MRLLLILVLGLLATAMPVRADIFERPETPFQVAQRGGGKSLSEAIEQVRRQTGGKILSAETRRQGDREVHHIKVLIDDKQVRTFKIPGRSLKR